MNAIIMYFKLAALELTPMNLERPCVVIKYSRTTKKSRRAISTSDLPSQVSNGNLPLKNKGNL
jgi:hypothetical protein